MKIHCYKNLFVLEDMDVDHILISNKICFGEKNCKYLIEDDELFKKCNDICNKVSKLKNNLVLNPSTINVF